jgi:hypothetical protein
MWAAAPTIPTMANKLVLPAGESVDLFYAKTNKVRLLTKSAASSDSCSVITYESGKMTFKRSLEIPDSAPKHLDFDYLVWAERLKLSIKLSSYEFRSDSIRSVDIPLISILDLKQVDDSIYLISSSPSGVVLQRASLSSKSIEVLDKLSTVLGRFKFGDSQDNEISILEPSEGRYRIDAVGSKYVVGQWHSLPSELLSELKRLNPYPKVSSTVKAFPSLILNSTWLNRGNLLLLLAKGSSSAGMSVVQVNGSGQLYYSGAWAFPENSLEKVKPLTMPGRLARTESGIIVIQDDGQLFTYRGESQ